MMEGRDSYGRKISLLSDFTSQNSFANIPQLKQQQLLPIYTACYTPTSPTESISSDTPALTRSESAESRAFATPSPITPSSSINMDSSSIFPSVHDPSTMSDMDFTPHLRKPLIANIDTTFDLPQIRGSESPASESRTSNVSATSAGGSKQANKKNQYPCPVAKAYGCDHYFTTSGHAARHAKKHTGRKDAICPECAKAFTRKDNMEQHRRTHQTVRGPAKGTSDAKVKKNSKPSSTKSDKSVTSPVIEASIISQMESPTQQHQSIQVQPLQTHMLQGVQPQQMPMLHQMTPYTMLPMPSYQSSNSTMPYYMNVDPVGSLPEPVNAAAYGLQRPMLYSRQYQPPMNYNSMPLSQQPQSDPNDVNFSYPPTTMSNALDALALAASGHKRDDYSSGKSSVVSTP